MRTILIVAAILAGSTLNAVAFNQGWGLEPEFEDCGMLEA